MTMYLLLAFPVLAAAFTALMPRSQKELLEYVALAVALGEALLALFIIGDVLRFGVAATSEIFQTDALGAFVLFFTTIVGLAATVHSIGHLREEVRKDIIGFRRVRQYFVLFHLFFFAMFLAAATTSPLVMWVAIEATTLAAAFLISFYNKPSALEAGWKHLIINSVGLLLGFLGTLLFLNAAATAGNGDAFVSWSTLRELGPSLSPLLVTVAFVFVFLGYGTKVGLVPMHTWLPDAHSKAPIPISSLLSGVLLNVALVAILRFRAVADGVVDPSLSQTLLIVFGVLSLVVAALIIFIQKNYKRMLAYSSIEHMGILSLGFGIGGAATVPSLFHMLYHALLKPILFLSAGNFFLKYSSTKIANVRGALTLLPISSIFFLAALLSVAGIPPSGIFFTKLAILAEGVMAHPYVVGVALLSLAVVFAGFIRHATSMLFSEAPRDLEKGEQSGWTLVSLGFLAIIFVTLSFWIPAPLDLLIESAAEIIH